MLTFVTGTPGSGKTLYTINLLKDEKSRPIYYVGIDDLKLDWHEIKDPFKFHEEVPEGGIVVFDEVQKYFPVRSPKDSVPAAMAFLETHRHQGIDVYFITQHPNLVDHHARRLCGQHVHIQRNYGLQRAVIYKSNQLFDYKNNFDLKKCEKTLFKYPSDVFDLYHSAEQHTQKRSLPKKLLLIPILLLIIIGAVIVLYNVLFASKKQTLVQSTGFSTQVISPKSSEQWSKSLTPALQGVPYTAPFYRQLAKPKVLPIVAGCIANDKDCRCYTQQGTRVTMSQAVCRVTLSNPQFNPFKDDSLQNKNEDEHQFRRRKSNFKNNHI